MVYDYFEVFQAGELPPSQGFCLAIAEASFLLSFALPRTQRFWEFKRSLTEGGEEEEEEKTRTREDKLSFLFINSVNL